MSATETIDSVNQKAAPLVAVKRPLDMTVIVLHGAHTNSLIERCLTLTSLSEYIGGRRSELYAPRFGESYVCSQRGMFA